MKFFISTPYAPIFCIGAAPTDPGIKDKFSIPYHLFSTQYETKSSQFSPDPTFNFILSLS